MLEPFDDPARSCDSSLVQIHQVASIYCMKATSRHHWARRLREVEKTIDEAKVRGEAIDESILALRRDLKRRLSRLDRVEDTLRRRAASGRG